MFLEVVCALPLDKVFDYRCPDEWAAIPADELVGRRVSVPFGRRTAVGVIVNVKATSETPADRMKEAAALLDAEPLLTPEMIRLGRWLADRYASSLGDSLFALLPAGKGNPVPFKDPGQAVYHDDYVRLSDSPFELTREQRLAVDRIHDAIYDHEPRAFLVHGVAAAGKTEVYIAAIRDALTQGRSALYLVPEIGLAIQIGEILKKRFGDQRVLLWHSDVTPKTRLTDWWRMKRGEVQVVIGPRSAAIAPLSHLGVVIVDEEHDASYKEDRKPRFHARDVAAWRAKDAGGVAIFGSATPSLEMIHASMENRIELLELTERATAASAPRVRLVDVSQERYRGGISQTLQRAVDDRIRRKEQVILFINRRGFHRYLKCPHCDWVAKCPRCNIALVHHNVKAADPGPRRLKRGQPKEPSKEMERAKREELRSGNYACHYCAYATNGPERCPDCGHDKLFAGGFGTERIEKEVMEKFPWAKVLRWDRDSASHRGDHRRIFEEFSGADYDVLVGTQMVAQGFNFPRVTLVGVLDADGSLHIPDFRAAERAYQVVTQVAGRAGRAMVTGDVLIQTRQPEHYALQHALAMDFKGFAAEELVHREEFNYPPYSHLVQITTDAGRNKKAEDDATAIADWAASDLNLDSPVGVLGPYPAKRKRKGKDRYQVIFKVPDAVFESFLPQLRAYLGARPHRFKVDVDPQSLL